VSIGENGKLYPNQVLRHFSQSGLFGVNNVLISVRDRFVVVGVVMVVIGLQAWFIFEVVKQLYFINHAGTFLRVKAPRLEEGWQLH